MKDVESEMFEELIYELGIDPDATPLFETEENLSLQKFFAEYSQMAKKGKSFNLTTVVWVPQIIVNRPIMNFNLYQHTGIVGEIANDHLLIEINGNLERFPSAPSNSTKVIATLLFNSAAEQQKSQLLFDLKFSNDWKINKSNK